MPKETCEHAQEPGDAVPDISLLATTRLVPQQAQVRRYTQQTAQHEAEIQRLGELAATLEQAITALVLRLRLTTEPRRYEALQHNCGDLQRFKLEIGVLQAEHQHAIERLQADK